MTQRKLQSNQKITKPDQLVIAQLSENPDYKTMN